MEMRLEKKALDKLFRRRDRIDLNPDYQRTPVWNKEKQQTFLDTLLKKWNVPKVYFRVLDEEHYECIDGQQRLSTATILISVIRDILHENHDDRVQQIESDYIKKRDLKTRDDYYKINLGEINLEFFRKYD